MLKQEMSMTELVAIENTSSVRLSARVIEFRNKIVTDETNIMML
jgi:hypothetical protein